MRKTVTDFCKKQRKYHKTGMKTALAIIIILMFGSGICSAIDSTPIKQPEDVNIIRELDIDAIIKLANSHSYDLSICDIKRKISETGIKKARSEYYPRINLAAGTEYTQNMRDGAGHVTTVGDSFINPYTRYQSIMGITLSYTLYDFGVRKGSLEIAKESQKIKEFEKKELTQSLNIEVLDRYSKILILQKELEIQEQILKLQKQNDILKSRLYNSHEISKNELRDSEIKSALIKSRILEIRSILADNLAELSLFTGEDYSPDSVKFKDIAQEEPNISEYDYKNSIIWKLYERQIKKKLLEIKIAKRNNFPRVTAYGRYYLYGSDQASYASSLGDIQQSNYTIGGMMNMPIFDGFRNRSDVEKAQLELLVLLQQRDQAIQEYLNNITKLKTEFLNKSAQINNTETIIKELEEKEKEETRLLSQRIITPIELNETKISKLEQEIQKEKQEVSSRAIAKTIQILREGDFDVARNN